MKIKKLLLALLLLLTITKIHSQKPNSETRQFIDNADITQINKDWNIKAEFKSGIGEIVSFFPVEATDLKSNKKVKSLQMDMTVKYLTASTTYFKSSWIDLNEVEEFIVFIEKYVIPNLKDKTERNQSVTYIFNSREITFSFYIEKSTRRISIYLKDNGVTDNLHYFWTETQVNKIPELLTMLKEIK
ncbi:hypothetical protein [Flavobacterium chungbukense]|uniref:Chalcone isomerase domain-containing protein n=1 Tax=Flavobacterium chungbukense TaxID=877464 RepID=A0ABP7XT32_9FLAO|nr:hypothetical protein [Flavobacterium chungbukense]MCC4921386.1 hypothetical protein [Flavobacterium chungbukense]